MPRLEPLPYVSELHPRNLRLADLYLRTGEAQSEAELRSGAIKAKLFGDIGQTIGNTASAIIQAPQQAREAAAKTEALKQQTEMGKLQLGEAQHQVNDRENYDLAMKEGGGVEQRTLSLLKDRPDLQERAQGYFKRQGDRFNEIVKDAADEIAGFGYSPDAVSTALDHLQENGFDKGKIDQFRQSMSSPEQTKAIVDHLRGVQPVAPKTREIKTTGKDGIETTQIVEDKPGQTFTSTPPPKEKPNPTEASLAVAAANGDPQAKAALAVMRAQRVERTSAQNPDGAADGLSKDAIEEAAHRVMLYGNSSIPTRFSEANKIKILNQSAAINKAIGQTPAAAAMRQAVQKADQGALNKITTQAASAEAFENKALQQADLVKELSGKVGRTQYPIINGALVSGKAATGDTPAHLLANALLTYTSEYAKIIEGSTGSAGGSSDAARRAAATLISTALSKGTLAATVDQMNKEMGMTRSGYRTTIDDIQGRMGGTPQPAADPDPLGIRTKKP